MRLGACQRADSSSTLSSDPGVPFLQLTLEIRVLHVQSTQLALKPFNAQFANRLPQDLNMHCRIAGAAAFVQPLPQRQPDTADHGTHQSSHAQHARRERTTLESQRPVTRTETRFAQLAVVVGALQPQRPQHALEVLAMPAGVARRLPAGAG